MPLEELNKEEYESIQKYLDDLMSPEEVNEFQKNLKSHPHLNEAMEFEIEIKDFLKAKRDTEFLLSLGVNPISDFEDIHNIRDLVEDIGQNWKHKKTKPLYLRPFVLYAVAASLLGFIMIAIWNERINKNSSIAKTITKTVPPDKKPDSVNIAGFIPKKQADTKSFFAQYFTPDKLPSRQPEYLAEAFHDYGKGKYNRLMNLDMESIPKPDQTRDASEEDSEDSLNLPENVRQIGFYYKGLAFLISEKENEAKANLQWVIKFSKNDSLRIKSQWYLALVYLKGDSALSSITPLLDHVSKSNLSPFNAKARELLKNIN